MAYLRCESCGAKALVAASRCPKCSHEFHLVDARGERVALVRCRGCGIMHRRGSACHWCPEKSARRWQSPVALQALAAAIAFAVIGAGTWRYGPRLQELVRTAPRAEATLAERAGQRPAGDAINAATAAPLVQIASAAPAGAAGAAVASVPADTVEWTPAVARTWVNVRSDAGRGGAVVGVIKPASKAMLGNTGRAGWRQVRSDSAIGWVDPRLFEADSASSRG